MPPMLFRAMTKNPIEGLTGMASLCDKCLGAAEPAAQIKTFEYEGRTLTCLVLVSSCMVCGHRWDDETYEIENSLFAEQARAEVSRQLQSAGRAQTSLAPRNQEVGEIALPHEFVNQNIRG